MINQLLVGYLYIGYLHTQTHMLLNKLEWWYLAYYMFLKNNSTVIWDVVGLYEVHSLRGGPAVLAASKAWAMSVSVLGLPAEGSETPAGGLGTPFTWPLKDTETWTCPFPSARDSPAWGGPEVNPEDSELQFTPDHLRLLCSPD